MIFDKVALQVKSVKMSIPVDNHAVPIVPFIVTVLFFKIMGMFLFIAKDRFAFDPGYLQAFYFDCSGKYKIRSLGLSSFPQIVFRNIFQSSGRKPAGNDLLSHHSSF